MGKARVGEEGKEEEDTFNSRGSLRSVLNLKYGMK